MMANDGDKPATEMTIRQRFAMAAMQGILANSNASVIKGVMKAARDSGAETGAMIAAMAVGKADNLLAAIAGPKEPVS